MVAGLALWLQSVCNRCLAGGSWERWRLAAQSGCPCDDRRCGSGCEWLQPLCCGSTSSHLWVSTVGGGRLGLRACGEVCLPKGPQRLMVCNHFWPDFRGYASCTALCEGHQHQVLVKSCVPQQSSPGSCMECHCAPGGCVIIQSGTCVHT